MRNLCIAIAFFPFHWVVFDVVSEDTFFGLAIGPFALSFDWGDEDE